MKKCKKEKEFETYLSGLNPADARELADFFDDLQQRTCCRSDGEREMREVYKEAVLFYADINMELSEILKRLDIGHLGGFYARPSGLWFPLDFVSGYALMGSGKNAPGVYEIVYTSPDEIIPAILQISVYAAVKRYPLFSCRIKKGLFCHYLESSKKPVRIGVYNKNTELCCGERSEFYKVSYKQNKIILSYVDGITDSHGASMFMHAIWEYYTYLLSDDCDSQMKENICTPPEYSESQDGFETLDVYPFEWVGTKNSCIDLDGVGARMEKRRTRCCTVSRRELEFICKQKGLDVKEYLLFTVCKAASGCTDRTRGEMVINVKYDARGLFPRRTLRNFSVDGRFSFNKEEELSYDEVKRGLKLLESKEAVRQTIGEYKLLASRLRYVLLPLKKYTAEYLKFTQRRAATCFFNYCDMSESWGSEAVYQVFRPSFNGVGCFISQTKNRIVISICNNCADPAFFDGVKEILIKDGVDIAEDRAIVKIKIS